MASWFLISDTLIFYWPELDTESKVTIWGTESEMYHATRKEEKQKYLDTIKDSMGRMMEERKDEREENKRKKRPRRG